MESLMPWAEFCALIEPHYPKAGNGRPLVGVERMLRMYCIANWFTLSDEGCEDSAAESFAEALEVGFKAFGPSACIESAREGITSFKEKRTPDFSKTK